MARSNLRTEILSQELASSTIRNRTHIRYGILISAQLVRLLVNWHQTLALVSCRQTTIQVIIVYVTVTRRWGRERVWQAECEYEWSEYDSAQDLQDPWLGHWKGLNGSVRTKFCSHACWPQIWTFRVIALQKKKIQNLFFVRIGG